MIFHWMAPKVEIGNRSFGLVMPVGAACQVSITTDSFAPAQTPTDDQWDTPPISPSPTVPI